MSPQPALSAAARRLYDQVAPVAGQDEANGWALAHLCRALAVKRDQAQLLLDGHEEPWAVLMDAEICPDWALDWLAQFAGVRLAQGAGEVTRRAQLRSDRNRRRGTVGAMVADAQAHLTGNRTVLVRERDGSAYRVTVITYTSETPDPAAVERAVRAQKPAGLILDYRTVAGQDYQQLSANHATYQAVANAYATYQAVADDTPTV